VAICVWEGAADYYREFTRHGGIYCGFLDNLYPRAFHRAQYGLGERGPQPCDRRTRLRPADAVR
jgi:uncharacterized protein